MVSLMDSGCSDVVSLIVIHITPFRHDFVHVPWVLASVERILQISSSCPQPISLLSLTVEKTCSVLYCTFISFPWKRVLVTLPDAYWFPSSQKLLVPGSLKKVRRSVLVRYWPSSVVRLSDEHEVIKPPSETAGECVILSVICGGYFTHPIPVTKQDEDMAALFQTESVLCSTGVMFKFQFIFAHVEDDLVNQLHIIFTAFDYLLRTVLTWVDMMNEWLLIMKVLKVVGS
ncbi:hypothetical protein Tco_1175354 [Tanacetum coccineum]